MGRREQRADAALRRIAELEEQVAELRERLASERACSADLLTVLGGVEEKWQRLERGRDKAIDYMNAAIQEAIALRLLAMELADPTTEPAPGAICRKVRLSRKEDAQAFAIAVRASTGCGPMEAIRCPDCPPQPVAALGRWWHVRHKRRSQRAGGWKAEREKKSLIQYFDPDALAEIRDRIENG
jgi:hypothetical protein